MRNKIFLIVGLLSLVLLMVWAFIPTATPVYIVRIEQGHFVRFVEDDGWTRVHDRYVIAAPIAGHLQRTSLREGDGVNHGDTVATIFPAMPPFLDERTLRERRERIRSLEANAQAASINAERAQLALKQAEVDLRRNEHLFEQHFISESAIDTIRLAKQLRQKELANAEKTAAASTHALAEARVALLNMPEDRTATIRPSKVISPVSGHVLRISQPSENVVNMGTPLLEIGDPTKLEILVELLTEDAAQVTPGMSARLSNWGGTSELEARVRLIEPSAFTKVSALGVEEQRVNVILDITSPANEWRNLGDHFRVDVKIIAQVADNVLMVPVGALFPVGSRFGFFLFKENRAKLSLVDVVARNGKQAWIHGDLKSGFEVIAYPPANLQDGDRVRPMSN